MENKPTSHRHLTDNEFLRQFEKCTLDPSLFSHEAHLRLAWLRLKEYSKHEAVAYVQADIRRFVKAVGASDKYNVTLTVAAVHIVHHFMQRYPTDKFGEFIDLNHELTNEFKSLVMKHYKTDIFNSPDAKKKYKDPELDPFDE